MKQTKIVLVLHDGVVALLAGYGVFATIQIRKLGARVDAVERQLAHALDPRIERIASNR
jgi:hypothetical protein